MVVPRIEADVHHVRGGLFVAAPESRGYAAGIRVDTGNGDVQIAAVVRDLDPGFFGHRLPVIRIALDKTTGNVCPVPDLVVQPAIDGWGRAGDLPRVNNLTGLVIPRGFIRAKDGGIG